jgi:tRNA threonylcarbamoyladenosine biosynthesis protein TsaE
MIETETESPAGTLALGRRLAAMLGAGDVLLLAGRLGVGKTLLVAGVAEGLGVAEPVTSPSFVLVRTYHGLVPVVHADVYRLGSSGEFDDLELPESARQGVLLIEWGDAVTSGVPPDHLTIRIEATGESSRRFTFLPAGTWKDRPLAELTA